MVMMASGHSEIKWSVQYMECFRESSTFL